MDSVYTLLVGSHKNICRILCLGAIVVVWIATDGKLGKLIWIVSIPCLWVVIIRICKILCLGVIVVVLIATDGKLGKLKWIVSIPCWWLVVIRICRI